MQKQDKLKEMGRQIGRLNDKIKLQSKFLAANAEEIKILRNQVKEKDDKIKEKDEKIKALIEVAIKVGVEAAKIQVQKVSAKELMRL